MNYKQWQKRYPDALKITLTSKVYVTITQARRMLYGEGRYDVKLLDSKETNGKYSFIFSEQAAEEETQNHIEGMGAAAAN